MMRLKIGFRNVLRNRSRSLLSILIIAGSVLGIIAFRGFSAHILHMLKDTTINNRYNHIQVATEAQWEMQPGPRKNQLMKDPKPLMDRLTSVQGVNMVSARLSFVGLISNGENTISVQGVGYDPDKEIQFQRSLMIDEGRSLNQGSANDVIVGAGLQKQLNVKVGDTITVISYTLDGVINAVDLNLVGVFRVGTEDVDSHVFMLPLASTQNLLDTDSVESITLRLNKTEETDFILPQIEKITKEMKPDSHAKSWYEMADSYRKIEQFYEVQNHVIEVILISLVLLGIMNSIGMTVYERTGEIGTVRAIGDKPNTVIFQFILEGAILGVMGVVTGSILGVVVSWIVKIIDFRMVLPNATFPVPIQIELVPQAFLVAVTIGLVTSIVSTLIPSLRATRISIVEALRRNI